MKHDCKRNQPGNDSRSEIKTMQPASDCRKIFMNHLQNSRISSGLQHNARAYFFAVATLCRPFFSARQTEALVIFRRLASSDGRILHRSLTLNSFVILHSCYTYFDIIYINIIIFSSKKIFFSKKTLIYKNYRICC